MTQADTKRGPPGSQTNEEKSKVFISYSRDDSVFADELVSGLDFAKFDVTIDRHAIMEGEDWKKRLGALIADADTVVFLLSPSSARSAVCRWEVDYSHSLSKRLIPVLVRSLQGEKAPDQLAVLSYVRFDEGRSFMSGLRGLVNALNTDIGWLREHTRYLQKAIEWDRGGRPSNRLLFGPDVEAAKAWAAQRPKYAPELTELHRDYLLASEREELARKTAERKRLDEIAEAQAQRADALIAAEEAHRRETIAERRRQNLRNAGTIVLSMVSVLLATLSLMTLQSYRDADRDFTLALLATADRLLREDKPTSSLVVADALDKGGVVRNFLAGIGLLGSVGEERVRIATVIGLAGPASSIPTNLRRSVSPATSLAYSAVDDRLAVGHTSGLVMIMNQTGAPVLKLLGHAGRVHSLKFSPNGKLLLSATTRQAIIWDLEQRQGRILCATGTEILDAVFHPKSSSVVWSQRDGKIVATDLATGQRIEMQEHVSRATALDFSRDGKILASAGDDGTIAIRSTENWNLVKKFATGRVDVIGVSINGDATRIATASLAGPIDIWPLDADQPAQHGRALEAPPDKRWRIRYSPDNRFLAIASWQGTIRLFDAASLDRLGSIDGNDTRINDIVFVENENRIISASEGGFVRSWSLATLRPMFATILHDQRETFMGKYSWDGKKFVAGGKGGVATLYTVLADGRLNRVCEVKHDNWVFGIAFSRDNRIIYSVGPKEGQISAEPIKVWSADDCKPVPEHVKVPPAFVVHVTSSPAEDKIAWGSRKGSIWISGTAVDAQAVELARAHTVGIGELDFSPDGKFLLSAGLDGKLLVWDVERRLLHRELSGHAAGSFIFTAHFAPNGHTIASSGSEPKVMIWDLSKPAGQEFVRDLPLLGGANRLAFSADGERLAVGSGNRAVSIWRTQDWKKIFQLNTLVGIRSVYGFHPIRGDLAFDGENGLIRIAAQPAMENARLGASLGIMKGLDVLFDASESVSSDTDDAQTIQAPARVCG